MALDPRIPVLAAQGAQLNLADIYAQSDARKAREQQMQMQRQQMDMQREEMDWRRQLEEVKLDERKAEAVKAGLEDMAAAVQWADSPEKWATVQQHYGQYDPQLAQVPFEQREQSLIRLGKMSDYLKSTAPKIQSIEPGGSLYSISPDGRNINELVRANPGSAEPLSPVSGGAREGATATNPQTGQKIQFRNGRWVPMGGGGSNVTGGFQP
ncbi:hypothetical protein [Tsuneonella sp. HG222]